MNLLTQKHEPPAGWRGVRAQSSLSTKRYDIPLPTSAEAAVIVVVVAMAMDNISALNTNSERPPRQARPLIRINHDAFAPFSRRHDEQPVVLHFVRASTACVGALVIVRYDRGSIARQGRAVLPNVVVV